MLLLVIVDVRGGGGGSVCSRLALLLPNVPQSLVAGHFLASGLVSGSHLDVLQVGSPGVPDRPAATPHLVAHPLGSACFQLPNSGCEMIRKANLKHRHSIITAPSSLHYQYGDKGSGSRVRVLVELALIRCASGATAAMKKRI